MPLKLPTTDPSDLYYRDRILEEMKSVPIEPSNGLLLTLAMKL